MEFAASIIAVIQLARSISEICGQYINKVKSEKQEILQFRRQIDGLREVLQPLQSLLEDPNSVDYLANTRALRNEVSQCCSTLEDLRGRIDPEISQAKKRVKFNNGLKVVFGWPLDRNEVAQAIETIEQYRSRFIFALQLDLT